MIRTLLMLVHLAINFYLVVAIFRFYLQLIRADYYNPLSQFVAKLTNPIILPLRRIVPSWRKYDTASLVLILLVQCVEVALIISYSASNTIPVLTILVAMLANILFIFGKAITYAMIIVALASWINPHPGGNPALNFLHTITFPFIRFVQRWIPPIAGIDFSPMIVNLLFMVARNLINNTAREVLPYFNWYEAIVEPIIRM
jgi:YggT family protein